MSKNKVKFEEEPNAIDNNSQQGDHHKHREWSNPIEFLMTCVGYAVGLGNVWRFPYLCFKNGGSAFVVAFVIMLFLVGLPLFFIDLTISQYSKFGPLDVWKISPPLRGIGACSLLVAGFVSLYYNVLICYSLIYLISSFVPKLPWTDCNFFWNDEKCCISKKSSGELSINGSSVLSVVCNASTESPAKQYFEKYVLEMSSGIDKVDHINWKLATSLFVCWLLIFLSLSKGVKTLGKVSYVTAIFPYIMITALLIRGVTLKGAMKGIEYYILKINTEKLFKLQTWVDATTQVYFCIIQGGLYTLGRHNTFHYNHQRTSIFVAILDGFTGILAGFAIFSVLGYMSDRTGIEVDKLAVGGPGLSFIVYPEALSLMPYPWIWCIFFFLMMITIGFGSILSLMECVLDSIAEKCRSYLNTKKKETIFRFCVCMMFYLIGLSMTTRAGIYIENLLNDYTGNYPVIICAALEAIGIGWIYGLDRLKADIKLMLEVDLNIFWVICYKFLTPALTIATLIISIIANSEVTLNDYRYPGWAHAIGWSIVVFILSPLPIFFGLSIYRTFGSGVELDSSDFKSNLKNWFKPSDDWKPAIKETPQEINETIYDEDEEDEEYNNKNIRKTDSLKMSYDNKIFVVEL